MVRLKSRKLDFVASFFSFLSLIVFFIFFARIVFFYIMVSGVSKFGYAAFVLGLFYFFLPIYEKFIKETFFKKYLETPEGA